jgi:hypothetical protein
MQEHVNMVSGTYPSAEKKDGYYEAMVSKNAMGYLGLSTGDTAVVSPYSGEVGKMEPIKVQITGVFEFKDRSDLYWNQGVSAYSKNLVIDSGLYHDLFMSEDTISLTANSNWGLLSIIPKCGCRRLLFIVRLSGAAGAVYFGYHRIHSVG